MKIIDAKISLNLAASQMNVKEQITPKMEKNRPLSLVCFVFSFQMPSREFAFYFFD